ncbi:MAG: translation elongation factor Ts [candidate division WS1 bacterium]|jgi:elongation factor Ts|nr:translation elongation factor Ts [candidate division WS1 bacterium]
MSVNAEQVKKLREKTGAGFMDCKNALTEAAGDMDKAVDLLRQKGIDVAMAREGRAAEEGVIASYIHAGNQIGVLVDLRSETDFVARTDEFREFGRDIAMQVAAMHPKWIAPEDVPCEALEHEREVLKQQALEEGKPEHIVEKMVEGRLQKFYESVCLIKQPFIRDDSLTIEDKLNELVSTTGERIVIARFVRFQVGEEQE